MGTQTQTKVIHRLNAQPSRQYDFLYDPLYTTSSAVDHSRSLFRSQAAADRIKRIPIYNGMFSELSHSPRFQLQIERRDPLPAWVNRQWRGYAEQMREAYFQSQFGQTAPRATEDVTGMHRHKYFRRPIIPFIPDMPAGLVLASQKQEPTMVYAASSDYDERPRTPATRNAQTQTDYRDGETQTDPYTPEYVVRPGEQPELLTLARLSFGRGLPAGLAEVEMIERARAKRAWEAQLPPLDDASQFDKRRRMMEEMEREEWAFREKEIEKLQEARLKVLIALLQKREESQQEVNRKRLDKTWSKMQEDKENKFANFRKKHIKALRRLLRDRTRFNQSLVPKHRDLTSDYSDPSSQVFAPLTRNGVFPDRFNEQTVVNNRFVNTYAGLLELERSLPDFVLQPRIRAPRAKLVTKDGFVKRAHREEQVLMEIHEHLKQKAEKRDREDRPLLRYLQKVEKPVPRPPTPSVPPIDSEEEERELAVIFLQQIIRGRAVQNMMFEGKEKRIELIRELRSTHALQEPEATQKAIEQQAVLALQRQHELHEHREALLDESLNALESETLSDMVDFLSKELIRLQEERRIHAFAMLAERRRRMREAEEAGRRQTEERRRREHDEIFKQSCKVHQTTVDAYLEDVILDAMNKAADERARSEVETMAERINDVAYEVEKTRTQRESEEIVAEMVYQFVLPNVQKLAVRDRIRQQQRRLLNAAHKEIFVATNNIVNEMAQTSRQAAAEADDAAAFETDSERAISTRHSAVSTAENGRTTSERPDSPRADSSVQTQAEEGEQRDQFYVDEEVGRTTGSLSAENTRPTSKASVRFAPTRSEIAESGDVTVQPATVPEDEPPAQGEPEAPQ